jgi:hypothetical protein
MKCAVCDKDKNFFTEMHNVHWPGTHKDLKQDVCYTCLGWDTAKERKDGE